MGKRDAVDEVKRKKKKQVAAEEEEAPPEPSEAEPVVGKKKKKRRSEGLEAEPSASIPEPDEATVKRKKKRSRTEATKDDDENPNASIAEPESAPAKKKKKKMTEEEAEYAARVEAEAAGEEPQPKKLSSSEPRTQDHQRKPKEPLNINKDLRVFVSNIPKSIDEATLKKDFEECGEVANVKLLLDGQTWLSRGIAFITFKEEAGLQAALEYDGDDYGGHTLRVRKAEAEGGSKSSASLGEKPEGCNSVVARRLHPEVTEEDLQTAFKAARPIKVGLLTDKVTGKSRCTARIDFKDGSGVNEAVKLHGKPLKGRPLELAYCQPKW